jgi:ankyrin repeat protein
LKHTPGDNRPFCAFLLAVRQEGESLIQFVADAGEDILAKDKKFGWTILHHAAYSGNVRAVRMALGEDSIQVDALDEGGRTPLHLAFLRGNMEAVELLLRSGAEEGMVDMMDRTPVDYAPKNRRNSEKDVLKSLPNYPRDIAFSPFPEKVAASHRRR